MSVFLFFVCVLGHKYLLRIAFHSSVADSISPKSFCSRRVEIQRTRREKTPSFVDAHFLNDSLSVSHLVESADQIRRASQKTDRFPAFDFVRFIQSHASQ